LNLIKEAGYGYIMASKIKGMGAAIKNQFLDPEGYIYTNDKEEGFRYKVMHYSNIFTDENKEKHCLSENLIVSYSPKRAKKDVKDRLRLVEKAETLL
jgi:hypothetical protein